MLAEFVLVFAILVAALGILAIVTPIRLLAWISAADLPARLVPIALLRLALGLALWLVADEVAHPTVFRVLAALMIVAGLATPLIGPKRIQRLVEWWMSRPPALIRGWGVLAAAFGIYLLQAVS